MRPGAYRLKAMSGVTPQPWPFGPKHDGFLAFRAESVTEPVSVPGTFGVNPPTWP